MIRIPASTNSIKIMVNNNGGFIILRFNVIFCINCKTHKGQNLQKDSQPFSPKFANIKKESRKPPISVIDFLLKLRKLNFTAKQRTTNLKLGRHCFDHKNKLSLMYLNHLK